MVAQMDRLIRHARDQWFSSSRGQSPVQRRRAGRPTRRGHQSHGSADAYTMASPGARFQCGGTPYAGPKPARCWRKFIIEYASLQAIKPVAHDYRFLITITNNRLDHHHFKIRFATPHSGQIQSDGTSSHLYRARCHPPANLVPHHKPSRTPNTSTFSYSSLNLNQHIPRIVARYNTASGAHIADFKSHALT